MEPTKRAKKCFYTLQAHTSKMLTYFCDLQLILHKDDKCKQRQVIVMWPKMEVNNPESKSDFIMPFPQAL